MSNNSPASIFGGFTPNEFDELVDKIKNNKPIYQARPNEETQKMGRVKDNFVTDEFPECPECEGSGAIEQAIDHIWTEDVDCPVCQGMGVVDQEEVDEIDF